MVIFVNCLLGLLYCCRDVLSDAKDTLSGSAFERELREGEPIVPGTEAFFSEDGSNTSPSSSSIRRVHVPRFDFE